MKEIDASVDLAQVSTFDRLRKTQTALNEEAAQVVLDRFGIKGVTLDNLEQVYNPLISGFGTMQAARTHLIKKGMTSELADTLAKRYIAKLEQEGSQIYSVMDFFNSAASSDALNTLIKSPLSSVHFSYQTWGDYTQGIADKQVQSALQSSFFGQPGMNLRRSNLQPVRPQAYRGFSTKATQDGKEKIIYSEEYLQRQEKDKKSGGGGKFFEFIQKIDKLDSTPTQTQAA